MHADYIVYNVHQTVPLRGQIIIIFLPSSQSILLTKYTSALSLTVLAGLVGVSLHTVQTELVGLSQIDSKCIEVVLWAVAVCLCHLFVTNYTALP